MENIQKTFTKFVLCNNSTFLECFPFWKYAFPSKLLNLGYLFYKIALWPNYCYSGDGVGFGLQQPSVALIEEEETQKLTWVWAWACKMGFFFW